MTTEKQPLDTVIKLFLGKDNLRPVFLKPSLLNGFVYATNGHVLLKAPENLFSNKYETIPDFPNCEGAMEGAFKNELETPLIINIEKLEAYIKTIPTVPLYESCYECSGRR